MLLTFLLLTKMSTITSSSTTRYSPSLSSVSLSSTSLTRISSNSTSDSSLTSLAMIAIDNEPRWTIDLRIATNFLPFTGDIPAGVVNFGTNTKIVATSIESFAELMVMNEIQLLSAFERDDLSTVR